jgi:hypothetical protein
MKNKPTQLPCIQAYRQGFEDGNESNYFPCLPDGPELVAYDRGYRDGQQFGDRRGKPWSFAELMALAKTMNRKEPKR